LATQLISVDLSRTANFNDANNDCSHATLDPDDQYSALSHVVTVDLANSNSTDIHVTYITYRLSENRRYILLPAPATAGKYLNRLCF